GQSLSLERCRIDIDADDALFAAVRKWRGGARYSRKLRADKIIAEIEKLLLAERITGKADLDDRHGRRRVDNHQGRRGSGRQKAHTLPLSRRRFCAFCRPEPRRPRWLSTRRRPCRSHRSALPAIRSASSSFSISAIILSARNLRLYRAPPRHFLTAANSASSASISIRQRSKLRDCPQ